MSQGIPREFWDERFSSDAYAYGTQPSRLLLSWADRIRTTCKTALVPACGEGRDAVFLASLGLEVMALDISPAGIAKTEALAAQEGVSLKVIEADLFKWEWPVAAFDLVVSVFAHMPAAVRPELHQRYIDALVPGGFLFVEGFTIAQQAYQKTRASGGPRDEVMLYPLSGLSQEFPGTEVVSEMVGDEYLAEGDFHTGLSAIVRAIYQKNE